MRTHLLLASMALLAAAMERPSPQAGFDCGTDTAHASDDFIKTVQELHTNEKRGSNAARAALKARDDTINVDAVFHIVTTADSKNDITNDMPTKQLDSLNDSYKPYNIHFNLINVTWTNNDAWATGSKDDDQAMKKGLRQGSYKTLNIYFQTDLTGGVLGRCTLPSPIANGKSDSSVYFNDGCNVNAHTMPGGLMDGFNSGKTAVHETGHWMGLLHTFEGYSCDGPGDYIDDTAQESSATDGCPTDKKSCGNADPIHNYMDYSIDSCYEGFTDQQVSRMKSMWGLYRKDN